MRMKYRRSAVNCPCNDFLGSAKNHDYRGYNITPPHTASGERPSSCTVITNGGSDIKTGQVVQIVSINGVDPVQLSKQTHLNRQKLESQLQLVKDLTGFDFTFEVTETIASDKLKVVIRDAKGFKLTPTQDGKTTHGFENAADYQFMVGPNDVVIMPTHGGWCGSDVGYANGSRNAEMPGGQLLGHEASGVVIAMGDNVTGVKLGDIVAPNPFVIDHHNQDHPMVKAGWPNLQEKQGYCGCGSHQGYMVQGPMGLDASQAVSFPVQDGDLQKTSRVAALIEVLANAQAAAQYLLKPDTIPKPPAIIEYKDGIDKNSTILSESFSRFKPGTEFRIPTNFASTQDIQRQDIVALQRGSARLVFEPGEEVGRASPELVDKQNRPRKFVVVGNGPIGNMVAALLAKEGKDVVIVGRSEYKSKVAKAYAGVKHVNASDINEGSAPILKGATDIIDCVGNAETLISVLRLAEESPTVIATARPQEKFNELMTAFSDKEATWQQQYRFSNPAFESARNALQGSDALVAFADALVTAVPLKDSAGVFTKFCSGFKDVVAESRPVKVQVAMMTKTSLGNLREHLIS